MRRAAFMQDSRFLHRRHPKQESSYPKMSESEKKLSYRNFIIPLVLVVVLVAFFYSGLGRYLSFETLRDNQEALKTWVRANGALAIAAYMLTYAAVTIFSLPGGLVMSITGGFLFGTVWGALYIVVGATAGATVLFIAAKTSLGDPLRAKAGPWLQKMEEGFQENALSYLLVLRLVPIFPFFVVNLVPAFLGVSLGVYVIGTFLGIIPGSFVFASVGAGPRQHLRGGGRVFRQGYTDAPGPHRARGAGGPLSHPRGLQEGKIERRADLHQQGLSAENRYLVCEKKYAPRSSRLRNSLAHGVYFLLRQVRSGGDDALKLTNELKTEALGFTGGVENGNRVGGNIDEARRLDPWLERKRQPQMGEARKPAIHYPLAGAPHPRSATSWRPSRRRSPRVARRASIRGESRAMPHPRRPRTRASARSRKRRNPHLRTGAIRRRRFENRPRAYRRSASGRARSSTR